MRKTRWARRLLSCGLTFLNQTCQFHYLREAASPIYELDRSVRKAMRKDLGRKVRETRKQLAHHLDGLQETCQPKQQQEREQRAVLGDYALGIQTALNFEGVAPFVYPGVQAYDALGEIETSLQALEKRGLV
jgi:hypothetical protein